MTTFDAHADLAQAVVTVPPAPPAGGLTVTVNDASVYPATPFNAVAVPPDVCASLADAEIVRVTGAAGNVLTILRAQEGTTAKAIAVGWTIANVPTVLTFTDIEDAVNATEAIVAGILANAVFDGDAAGGDLDGTYPDPTLREIVSAQTGIGGPADGVVLDIDAKGRVTGLTTTALEGVPPGGPAGGVLSGQYPDPGFAVDMATQAELDALAGSVVLDGAAAGGVLSGTYPDPGFAVDMATQAELDAVLTFGSGADLTVDGITLTMTAGEALAFGDPVYVKSDGKVWKADANGAATFPSIGVAAASASANASVSVLVHGVARNDAWNWAVGGSIYLSITAGLTQTQPVATNDVIQVLGLALTADVMYVAPDLFYVSHV